MNHCCEMWGAWDYIYFIVGLLQKSKGKVWHEEITIIGNERKKQRDQRRNVEHNVQGLHTIEIMFSSSFYAFIYMCRLWLALTTYMGQCHQCNLSILSLCEVTLYGNLIISCNKSCLFLTKTFVKISTTIYCIG